MSDEARPLGRQAVTREPSDPSGRGRAQAPPRASGRGAGHSPGRVAALRLSRTCQLIIAAAWLVSAIGVACTAATPRAGLPGTVALGLALLLLASLAFLQRRSRSAVSALAEDCRRANQLASLNAAVIASFAMAIDAKDQHTHGHTERVREIARLIGEEVGLNADELEALKTAAMLHDIGKLAVPDYILSKPDQLTQEEMKKVKTHTLVGAAILEPVQFPWPVIPIIRSHHEWYDGSGYPDGLAGEQIPLGARILAVADVYDALLSHRPYRPAMTVQEAAAFMRERAGSQFDPSALNACFRVLAAQQASDRFGFIFDSNALALGPQDTPGQRAIYMDIKQAHQELLALYEIVQTMGQSLNVEETVDLVISKTKRIIDFSTCVLFICEPEEGDIVAFRAAGLYSEQIQGRRMRLGSGVSGMVVKTGKAAGLGCAAGDDLILLLGPEKRHCALTEVLTAPLGTDVDIIGCLTLYRPGDRPFTEDDERLVSAVARQATVAINNARQYELTRQSALTDQLTGLHNARYFFMRLEQELSRARRDHKPVSLIAIDLNNLKQINDNFGHQQGDRALRILAEVFNRHVRDYDTVVRYAGDEFFIILPDTTNQKAYETANRIKRAVRDTRLEIPPNRTVTLSGSFGVATFPGDAKEPDALIAVADRAMYADKNLNRQAALLIAGEARHAAESAAFSNSQAASAAGNGARC